MFIQSSNLTVLSTYKNISVFSSSSSNFYWITEAAFRSRDCRVILKQFLRFEFQLSTNFIECFVFYCRKLLFPLFALNNFVRFIAMPLVILIQDSLNRSVLFYFISCVFRHVSLWELVSMALILDFVAVFCIWSNSRI